VNARAIELTENPEVRALLQGGESGFFFKRRGGGGNLTKPPAGAGTILTGPVLEHSVN